MNGFTFVKCGLPWKFTLEVLPKNTKKKQILGTNTRKTLMERPIEAAFLVAPGQGGKLGDTPPFITSVMMS